MTLLDLTLMAIFRADPSLRSGLQALVYLPWDK
jgi:hypothetical protein